MVRVLRLIGLRHLRERPLRTLLTISGIALGVAVSVAIRTANVDVLKSFEEAVLTVAGKATLEVSGRALKMDEQVIAILRRHPAVVAATPILQDVGIVLDGSHKGQTVVLMGLDLLEAADLKGFQIQGEPGKGSSIQDLLDRNGVFLGTRLADDLGLVGGNELSLYLGSQVHRLHVLGVIAPEAGVRSVWSDVAVMDIAAAQPLFEAIGLLDRIDLVTAPERSVDELQRELQGLLPAGLTVRRPSHRTEQVERMVRAFQLNLTTLSGVGLLVGLLLVYNTVSFNVVQRRREIGIFRVLGMSRGGIAWLFLAEAGLMGAAGGLAGSALGVVLAKSLVGLMTRTVSDLYVPVPAMGGGAMGVPGDTELAGVFLGIGVSMVGALGPSTEASRTAPARALAPGDYEVVQDARAGRSVWASVGLLVFAGLLALAGPVSGLPVFGYVSALSLLLGLSCLAPALIRASGWLARGTGEPPRRGSQMFALARLAADQVARTPGRNAVTVSTLMVGIAIMVGVGIMIHSFRQTVVTWIDQTILADLVVAPTSWLKGEEIGVQGRRIPNAWRESLQKIPGVAAVDPYREVTVEVQGRPVSLVSRDLSIHAERSRYLFLGGESVQLLTRTVETEGVILSEVLARSLLIQAGDTLKLVTPSGERRFPVIGVFYDYATDGGKLVMDRRLYQEYWRDESATVLAVYLDPGTDPDSVRLRLGDRLRDLAGAEGTAVMIKNAELKAEILAIFDRTFTITYVLEFIAVIIAVLGIANTLLTSVLERQREVATLRAIGASGPQVRRLVLWESFHLGLLGAGLGLAGGLLLSVLLIEVINKQSFGWSIQPAIPWGVLVEAVGLAVTAALVAGYFPARWAAQQPVVEGLRYE